MNCAGFKNEVFPGIGYNHIEPLFGNILYRSVCDLLTTDYINFLTYDDSISYSLLYAGNHLFPPLIGQNEIT